MGKPRAFALAFVAAASLRAQTDSCTSVCVDSIARAQADSGFSGVVLISRARAPIFIRGYAKRGERAPAPDRRYNIASITKSFTAAAIVDLREQHKLTLDDSIGRFFAHVPPEKRSVTLRQLLTHTSGMAGNYSGAGHRDRASAVRAILARPQLFPPGEHYAYMDDDFELLAAVVEVTSHRSWEQYVAEHLLQPLGLTRTGFQGGDWGHRGADGMTSTARDLLRWVRALEAGKVINPTISAELRQPLIFVRSEPPYTVHYGYGTRIYVRDSTVTEVMYSGSGDAGNTSVVRMFPNGDVIIVLSSAGQHRNTTWASYVATLIQPRVMDITQ